MGSAKKRLPASYNLLAYDYFNKALSYTHFCKMGAEKHVKKTFFPLRMLFAKLKNGKTVSYSNHCQAYPAFHIQF